MADAGTTPAISMTVRPTPPAARASWYAISSSPAVPVEWAVRAMRLGIVQPATLQRLEHVGIRHGQPQAIGRVSNPLSTAAFTGDGAPFGRSRGRWSSTASSASAASIRDSGAPRQ